MKMKFGSYLRVCAVAFALLTGWSPVHAAMVTDQLGVVVIGGPGLGATGTIDVTYDSSDLAGIGEETLGAPQVDLLLTVFGQVFTSSDDVDFPDFPRATWNDGVLSFIDFVIAEPNSDIIDPTIATIAGGSVVNGVWQAETFGFAVPLPGAAWLFGSALLGLVAVARRRTV